MMIIIIILLITIIAKSRIWATLISIGHFLSVFSLQRLSFLLSHCFPFTFLPPPLLPLYSFFPPPIWCPKKKKKTLQIYIFFYFSSSSCEINYKSM